MIKIAVCDDEVQYPRLSHVISRSRLFSGGGIRAGRFACRNGKEDGHGIGLSNMRREAEKYMGKLELGTNQREFSATVLLQERSSL